jgi:hypothetical protein
MMVLQMAARSFLSIVSLRMVFEMGERLVPKTFNPITQGSEPRSVDGVQARGSALLVVNKAGLLQNPKVL